MLKTLLIEHFRDGDYILFSILFFVILFVTFHIINELLWLKTPSFVQDCTLVSQNYFPRYNRHITVWDCGKYGRLVANDEYIFRFAKDISTLILKKKSEEVRIIGIEK